MSKTHQPTHQLGEYQLKDGTIPQGFEIHHNDLKALSFSVINLGVYTIVPCEFHTQPTEDLVNFLLDEVQSKTDHAVKIIIDSKKSTHNTAIHSKRLTLESHSKQHTTQLDQVNIPEHQLAEHDLAEKIEFSSFDLSFLSSSDLAQFLTHSDGEYVAESLSSRFAKSRYFYGLLGRVDGDLVCAGILHQSHPKNDTVGIEVLGVHKDHRNQGLGRLLHAQLMKQAKNVSNSYAGLTSADNKAMLKVMQSNGCQFNNEQWCYTFSDVSSH